ncbi:uncharacterized protein [Spinacia oleracea]|uniref:Retrotransposon Copia-like N-terminal domain-containing protein n=1 Tax=Spinacia oleracea TaxID=3562 RepID=A0ABM3RIW2_SPIOL|nr:uncharacterized protein LOC110791525 [Spinacia oleracea]
MGNLSSLSHWIWNRDNINPWVALFKIQARVHDVLERIIPPKDDGKKAAYEKAKATDLPLWNRLDAPVLQWIYATISTVILNSILIDDDLAEHAWESVADLFHDNKHSRALFLSNEFTTTKLADFSTTNAYCNQLKSIVDQLANVGAPVNDHALVFKLLQGLNEPRNKRMVQPFVAHDPPSDERSSANNNSQGNYNNYHNYNNNSYRGNNNRKNNKSGGRNNGKAQRGGGSSGGGGSDHNAGSQNTGSGGTRSQQQWQFPWQFLPRTLPPSPYPTYNWVRPNLPSRPQQQQAGILGPMPQHSAYQATAPSPTDIEAAMYTLGITPPDPNWYMDTGATSHMTSAQGFSDGDAPTEV